LAFLKPEFIVLLPASYCQPAHFNQPAGLEDVVVGCQARPALLSLSPVEAENYKMGTDEGM